MSRPKRIAVAIGATGLLGILAVPAVLAWGGDGGVGGGKVSICHATRSEKNPYVLIRVGQKGADAHLDKHGAESDRATRLGREDFEVSEEAAEDVGEEVIEEGERCPPQEPEETPEEPEETPAG